MKIEKATRDKNKQSKIITIAMPPRIVYTYDRNKINKIMEKY
jgi:hypothetical protein